ncbi:MAG: hypothetical protein JO257_17170 [Deltaproteobacteria bacterium]|nr:hypothetical protein [Deltaproteobacteria bacterium]
MRVALIALLLFAGCLPPPVYRVQRDVRAAHAIAPLWSGSPMQGPVEVSTGASNLVDARAPRIGDDPTVASEVPSMQLRGELRFRFARYGQIAVIHDHAIASTYRALDPTQAPVDHDTAQSLGFAIRGAIPVDDVPGLSIGLGFELLQWWLPYVEYRSCVANCDGVPLQEMTSGTDTLAEPAFQVTPSYRSGALTLFAGVYATPHARVERKGTEYSATDYDSEIVRSQFNFIAHAGAEVTFGYISVLAQLQQDLVSDPVSYGPSLGLALSVHAPESM